jgi:hypothetical protein
MIGLGDKPVPQDINIVMRIGLDEVEPGKVAISVPKELRLTSEAFGFIHRMVQEQGFELVGMNIAEEHIEEAKELPNVAVVEKSTE